ncbi:MAG: glycerol dehydrogenase [Pseudomonadales bacterium]
MNETTAYDPASVFTANRPQGTSVPRVFIAPQRYIQGDGVLDSTGQYISLLGVTRVAVLASERGKRSEGPRLGRSLSAEGIESVIRVFGGECSLQEIELHRSALVGQTDCLVALGGGKCVDAGKSIAYRLGVPVVVIPTLASNDAPCSALSVLYEPSGAYSGFEFFPQSPALVVVDTSLVATAPERFLVSGMGDAMATWYEARACLANPAGVNALSGRPTLASTALGEICAHTLFRDGLAASDAVRQRKVDDKLESVVEANTLLSGLGFESGGVAVAHGVAQTCTMFPDVDAQYLHGEMVAIGTLVQLALESDADECLKVASFFAQVGLPVTMKQLSLDVKDTGTLGTLIEGTLAWPFTPNMPFPVDDGMLKEAIRKFDEVGSTVTDRQGDEAYRRLHND